MDFFLIKEVDISHKVKQSTCTFFFPDGPSSMMDKYPLPYHTVRVKSAHLYKEKLSPSQTQALRNRIFFN